MSSVREYFKAREKRTSNVKSSSYKEKIRGHKLTIFYRVVLSVLLVIAIVVAIFIQWRDKTYTESVEISSSSINIVQGTKVKNLNGNLLIYSKDGASCINTKGTTIWNQTFEMQDPMISICKDVVALGDYNGSTIYVMNSVGSMGEIKTNLPVRYFYVATNGEVVATLDDGSVTWIYLYDATGGEISHFKTSMNKSGYPVTVSISPNGKLVGVSYLYVDSGIMQSSVGFYNFGKVGQNEEDNYMSGYNYLDTIVPHIQFINNDTAYGISDDRIMFFSGNERPVSIKEHLIDEEVQSVYHNEEYVGLVFNNTTEESPYRLDVYNKVGDLITSKKFDLEYTDIIFNKDQIIIYNDLQWHICNVNGANKYIGNFDKTTSLIIPTASRFKYIIVTPNSIDVFELK